MGAAEFVPAVAVHAVSDGQAVVVPIAGRAILVCNSQGNFFAIENKCSHAEEPLECGRIRNGWIACPAHGARFELATGAPISPPAQVPINTFPLRVVDGVIEVAI